MHPPWHRELAAATAARYRLASRAEKTRILDDFCATTGYHRKYAIRRLGQASDPRPSPRRGRPRKFGFEAVRLLASIWIAAGCPWSRRLQRDLPRWIDWAKRRHDIPAEIEKEVLSMSARTIDRRLQPYREQLARWPEHLRRRIGRGEAKTRIFYSPPRRGSATTLLLTSPAPGRLAGSGVGGLSAPPDPDRLSVTNIPTAARRLPLLEVKRRKERGIVILSVQGEMVRQAEAFPVMKKVIEELDTERYFVIDLGKVEKMDSAGVGELVAINAAVKEKNGKVRLANLDDKVGKLLQMALVHQIIPVFDTQKEAMESFGQQVPE